MYWSYLRLLYRIYNSFRNLTLFLAGMILVCFCWWPIQWLTKVQVEKLPSITIIRNPCYFLCALVLGIETATEDLKREKIIRIFFFFFLLLNKNYPKLSETRVISCVRYRDCYWGPETGKWREDLARGFATARAPRGVRLQLALPAPTARHQRSHSGPQCWCAGEHWKYLQISYAGKLSLSFKIL